MWGLEGEERRNRLGVGGKGQRCKRGEGEVRGQSELRTKVEEKKNEETGSSEEVESREREGESREWVIRTRRRDYQRGREGGGDEAEREVR